MPGLVTDPALRERLADALAAELPGIARDDLQRALDRAIDRVVPPPTQVVDALVAGADPRALVDRIGEAEEIFRAAAQWEQLVDLQLARVAASDDSTERAALLADLAALFERDMDDPDRALSALLGGIAEVARVEHTGDLLRLADVTGRWADVADGLRDAFDHAEGESKVDLGLELATIYRRHLDDPDAALAAVERAVEAAPRRPDALRALVSAYTAFDRPSDAAACLERLVDVADDGDRAAAELYREIAAAWERLGELARAAECHEWALSYADTDAAERDAYERLARLYRLLGDWRALIDTLGRQATTAPTAERAPLYIEMARIYETELGDDDGALDLYQVADDAEPDRADVLTALARLYERRESHDDALSTLERLAAALPTDAERAEVLLRAADLAWHVLRDGDAAHDLLIRARRADAADVAAIDALAALHRDRGELVAVLELLADAASTVPDEHRARFLTDAGHTAADLGELDRAAGLFAAARDADPDDHHAAIALADVLWRTRRDDELVPVLEWLCGGLTVPSLALAQLLRLGEAARAIGRPDVARAALSRAVELAPADTGARRALGDLLFEQQAWAEAREALTAVLDAEETEAPREVCVELHHRIGRCDYALGEVLDARLHIETALALDPGHRPSLEIHAELDAGDPMAFLADKLALADVAPADERGALLAEIGDFYARELDDPISARAVYREALPYRPTDHVLLNKCLGVTAEEGDWRHSLDLVHRLIDTESDRELRAKYRRVAAMICRDELDDIDGAASLLADAVHDAPHSVAIADELETLLAGAGRHEELAKFYYVRLAHMRTDEARPGERLRLWERLGEVCAATGHAADAVCAYEVAVELEPGHVHRRQRLAALYVVPGIDERDKAIEQHQQILATEKRRVASYEALRELYAETGQAEKADACADALAIISMRPVPRKRRAPTARPLSLAGDGPSLAQEDFRRLAMGEVDPLLSALFGRVAPRFAVERAVPRLSGRSALSPRDPRPAAEAFRLVTGVLGIDPPAAHVNRQQSASCLISLRHSGARLVPVLTLSDEALASGADDHALIFELTRRLVDLRADRFARLLCPRAEELTQSLELALALGAGEPVADLGHTAQWLAASLEPIDLDQLTTIGERLANDVAPERAAMDWLDATERVGDRVGYVVTGDLATSVRAIERSAASRSTQHERILDLVWASVTEPVFTVRARLERWADRDERVAGTAERAADKGNVA